ncbi:MAG: hypothetical protein KGM43_10160 [Planctomycetota bacterium]|nr:hypothetical protein [Planctomycetota bacterium]
MNELEKVRSLEKVQAAAEAAAIATTYGVLACLVIWGAIVALGVYLADARGRSRMEGFWITLLFGPLGIVVIGFLPIGFGPSPPAAPGHHPRAILPIEPSLAGNADAPPTRASVVADR